MRNLVTKSPAYIYELSTLLGNCIIVTLVPTQSGTPSNKKGIQISEWLVAITSETVVKAYDPNTNNSPL